MRPRVLILSAAFAFGGGLAFDVSGRTMTIGVRYEAGFTKLVTDTDSKNRVLSFVGTFEWPFPKQKLAASRTETHYSTWR